MSVNMSLDEIIAAHKKTKSGRPAGKFRSDGEKKERGGARTSGGRSYKNFSFSDSVPEGKWKHDKFQESESAPASTRTSAGGSGGNPNRKVTVNVSNLEPSVVSADLEELFENYDFDSVAVHFNENGESLCSGSVVCKRGDAQRMLDDFKGVNLDGLALKLVIVDDGSSNRESIRSRLQFTNPRGGGRIQKNPRPAGRTSGGGADRKRTGKHFLDRVVDSDDEQPSGGQRQRGGRNGGRGGGRGGRGGRVEKTAEQLDAELEEYMKKK